MTTSIRDVVPLASSEPVIQAGGRLAISRATYPFVEPSHPFCEQNGEALIEGFISGSCTASDRDRVGEFVALASSYHLFQGWRFLSKSAYSLLNRSNSSAIHLAYYAELRAARSLLAGSGIYIGNKHHFALDKHGALLPFNSIKPVAIDQGWKVRVVQELDRAVAIIARRLIGRVPRPESSSLGTHTAAWAALKEWAELPLAAEMVAGALPVFAFDGIDWIDAARAKIDKQVVTAGWLKDWSIDIPSLKQDQFTRNAASYGVDLGADAFNPLSDGELAIVRLANEACISFAGDGTDAIDLALLYDFCDKSARLFLSPKKSKKDRRVWEGIELWLVNSCGYGDADAKAAVDVVRKARDGVGGQVLEQAKRDNKGPGGVFARAFLLLRLATALHNDLWKKIRQVAGQRVEAWQEEYLYRFAENAHVLDQGQTIGAFADLEYDISDALTEIESWLSNNTFSGYALWGGEAASLRMLCQFERLALWESAP